MPKQTISYLKSIFITGARPLQQWWYDVFDSFVHKDDVAVINQTVINNAINAYDNILKGETVDGVVNTLGDVFKVFQNYSDTRNLHNELQWANIPGRPTSAIPLGYSAVQRISMSNISTGDWPATGGTSNARVKTLKQLLGVAEETPIAIADMHLIRNSVLDTTSATVIIHSLSAIDIGLNPRTTV